MEHAQRVELTDVVTFLENIQENDAYLAGKSPRKKFIIPLPDIVWQISKNMLFRGNAADWKHYVTYPLTITRFAWKKMFGSSGKSA